VQAALAQLRPLADRYDISMAQLALAWVTSHPDTCAIAGARSVEQARDNAAAGDVVLAAEDLAAMDHIGRTVTDHLDPDPVMWTF
jgi:aryl-alcohol dehydrogenase-like predicted oxidoreductase